MLCLNMVTAQIVCAKLHNLSSIATPEFWRV
jgi:hypothetical protein